ncbi:MAG: hypothetical protein Q8P71_01875 [bacterium]|nr:hypothetical protein [bacterium]
MAQNQSSTSFLDTDAMFFIFFALMLDFLGYIGLFLTLGIGGALAGLTLGIPLTLWMMSKDTNAELAQHRLKSLKGGKNLGVGQAAKRKIAMRGLKRYLLGSFLVFWPYWTLSVFKVIRTGSSGSVDTKENALSEEGEGTKEEPKAQEDVPLKPAE